MVQNRWEFDICFQESSTNQRVKFKGGSRIWKQSYVSLMKWQNVMLNILAKSWMKQWQFTINYYLSHPWLVTLMHKYTNRLNLSLQTSGQYWTRKGMQMAQATVGEECDSPCWKTSQLWSCLQNGKTKFPFCFTHLMDAQFRFVSGVLGGRKLRPFFGSRM